MHVRTIRARLLSPAVVILAISIVLLLFSLYSTQHTRAFNSDDVRWQNILLTWKPFSGQSVGVGDSSGVDKLPFFMLVGHFFGPSRKVLVVESSILAVFGFMSFYLASLYFLIKARVKLSYSNLVPFLWLASFGYNFVQLYYDPNWRGAELGLTFITFMLVAMIYNGDFQPLRSWLSKSLTVLGAALIGILIASDPTFLYFTIAPIVLFTIIVFALKKISKQQLAIIYGSIAFSLIFSKCIEWLYTKAGIHVQQSLPAQFVSFDQLGTNIMTAIHGLLMIFGADFTGYKVGSLIAISAVANAVILGFILYKARRPGQVHPEVIKRSQSQTLVQYWTRFFYIIAIVLFVIYASSTLVNITAYRYLFVTVQALILLLALVLGSMKAGKAVLVTLLLVATLGNIWLSVRYTPGFLQAGSLGNTANAINYELIQTVEARGYTKGYGIYWQAQINTYLSGNKVNFLPVLCGDGQTTLYHWLINENRFNVPAAKSFYIIDPDYPGQICDQAQVEKQFGPPTATATVENKTILFYNRDLAKNM